MIRTKWWKLAGVFCLGGCIGLNIVFSAITLSSWSNSEGQVILYFNHFHERLIESILFPLTTIGTFAYSWYLAKSKKLL